MYQEYQELAATVPTFQNHHHETPHPSHSSRPFHPSSPDTWLRLKSLNDLTRQQNPMLAAISGQSDPMPEVMAINTFQAADSGSAAVPQEARQLCQYQADWLHARAVIGPVGLLPLPQYHTDTLGLQDQLSEGVWMELHNPGSKVLSIRMLSPAALAAAEGQSQPGLHEFTSFQDIKMAVATLRCALQVVMPWNLTVAALDMFLTSINYGENLLANRSNQFSFLAQFIDEVLQTNGDRWLTSRPFLSFQDISNRWVADITRRLPPTAQARGRPRKGAGARPRLPWYVCKNFNGGKCDQQELVGHVAPWNDSLALRHICSLYLPDQGRYCLKRHARIHHQSGDA